MTVSGEAKPISAPRRARSVRRKQRCWTFHVSGINRNGEQEMMEIVRDGGGTHIPEDCTIDYSNYIIVLLEGNVLRSNMCVILEARTQRAPPQGASPSCSSCDPGVCCADGQGTTGWVGSWQRWASRHIFPSQLPPIPPYIPVDKTDTCTMNGPICHGWCNLVSAQLFKQCKS